jgi:hypothetical protein
MMTLFVPIRPAGSQATDRAQLDLAAFIERPTEKSWGALERDFNEGVLGRVIPPAAAVMEYDRARIHRDFPNMMIVEGLTEEEYGEEVSRDIEDALRALRAEDGEQLWRILRALTTQGFDPQLARTGGEIAARLSLTRFDELAEYSVRKQPRNAEVLESVRETWATKTQ